MFFVEIYYTFQKWCTKCAELPLLAQLVEHLTVVVFKSYQVVAGSIPAERRRNQRTKKKSCKNFAQQKRCHFLQFFVAVFLHLLLCHFLLHRALVPLRALASRAVDHILQWVYSSPSTAARSRLDRNCPNQSFIFSEQYGEVHLSEMWEY